MAASTVSVTFIDDLTSEPIGTVDLPVDNLPDTFELETTLHLGEVDWSVVHAAPQNKTEFVGTGKLLLRLRKVEKVDLSDILFSMPSICNRIPAVRDAPPSADDLDLAEDDWRQFELVSRAFAAESDTEIAAIITIHKEERASVGWKKIHVRKRPDPPIASTLGRKDIEDAFGGVTFNGVCLGGAPVVEGFSFRSGDLRFYGIEEEGKVSVLGLVQEPATGEAIDALAALARDFDLELVHWCRCVRVAWDEPLFGQMLRGEV